MQHQQLQSRARARCGRAARPPAHRSRRVQSRSASTLRPPSTTTTMSRACAGFDAGPERCVLAERRRSAAARRRPGPAPAPAWRRPGRPQSRAASAPSSTLSDASASAASPGRSRSKRPTKAAQKCCASAAPAAEPADEQLAARGDAADQRLRGIGNRPGEAFRGLVLEVSAVEELLLDALFEHEHGSYDTALVRRFLRALAQRRRGPAITRRRRPP